MKLILNSPANLTSYGYCGSYLFRELVRNNIEVEYFPIGDIQLETRFAELEPHFNREGLLSPKTNCLKIWHQHDLSSFVGNGLHIGFPIFELSEFTKREKSHLSSCDVIVVCSEWAKQIVESQVNVSVHVVPLGYDPEVFKPSVSKRQKEGGSFVFANFGKWEIRKGHDVLVQAFSDAFTPEDDVELWMFPHNPFLTDSQRKSWENYYKSSKLGSKIKIFPRINTQEELSGLMQQIDCGVFPTRAEGWNLEALECLACEKEVISTNYSGHTEFLNKSNSFLIEPEGMETAYDGVFFNGQGKWMKWTKSMVSQLIENMKEMYKRGGYSNPNDSTKQYTWTNSGKKLVEVLKQYDR